jgi:hypothetical protein
LLKKKLQQVNLLDNIYDKETTCEGYEFITLINLEEIKIYIQVQPKSYLVSNGTGDNIVEVFGIKGVIESIKNLI